MSRGNTAAPFFGIARIFSKFLSWIAMYFPLSGAFRARLQMWRGVQFDDVSSCYIGSRVYIDDMNPRGVRIGANVVITNGSKILTHFYDSKHCPVEGMVHRFYYGDVSIGKNTFIGMNVVVGRPVVIGDGVVVAANSLVMNNLEDNCIYVGVPAKKIKSRFDK